tara:strand:- start:1720 stop:3315 length:1596 start_codon:yes stop_codon:yes gene_type:complete
MSKGIAVRAVLLTGAIIIAFALGAALALRGMLPAIPGVTGKALQEIPAAAKDKAAPAPVKPGTQKKPQEQRRPLRPGEPAPYYGDLNSLAAVNVRDASLDTIAKGLQYPWAMEILSSTEALVTEIGGSLQRVDLGDGSITAVTGLPEIPSGKGQLGLMDIALHPDFTQNRLVYFTHAAKHREEPARYTTALSRAQLKGNALEHVERLLTADPFTKAPANFGGAIAFDAAGYLYVGIGDRTKNTRAQDMGSLHGKILRLMDDGSIPTDNPFVEQPGIDPRIYAAGVRNTQGLVFDTASGKLFQTEHGPMGGDEVNVIEAGRNYGWPTITYGANYTTEKIGLGTRHDGLQQPLYFYLPSIAASPITIYHGAMFPEWEGHLLVGALKGAHVSKLALVDGQIRSEHGILQEAKGRIRDLKVASDGSLYLLVQNGGRLMRLHRDPQGEALEGAKARDGYTLYQQLCSSCHSAGLEGVPQLDQPSQWEGRREQGIDALYRNTLEGIGDMPARGLCDNCSDEEIRGAVEFMLKKLNAQ